MKISKDIRRLSRNMVRASFVDGALDRGRVTAIVAKDRQAQAAQLHSTCSRIISACCVSSPTSDGPRIESATALDKAAGEQIVADLQRRYGKGLTTEFSVNPALLGGVRIRVGSDVWDSSVRNRLERLQQKL